MDQKISELPAATLPLTGAELVPVVRGGITEQVPVSAFGAQPTRYRRGAWYCPQGVRQGNDSYQSVAARLDAQLFFLWAPMRVQAIGEMGMNFGAAAGQQAKLAIYAVGQNGYPVGAPIYESAVINTPSTNGTSFSLTGLDLTLQPGPYYIVWQFNNSAIRMRRADLSFSASYINAVMLGSSNVSSSSYGLSLTGLTFGNPFPTFTDDAADWTNTNGPMGSNNFFALRIF